MTPSDISAAFKLASATSAGAQIVRLRFADGFEFDLDLSPDLLGLDGPLVEPLKNPAVFSKMKIAHGSLVFPTGLDYGADVLRLWCENGSVASQDRTDELAARLFRFPVQA